MSAAAGNSILVSHSNSGEICLVRATWYSPSSLLLAETQGRSAAIVFAKINVGVSHRCVRDRQAYRAICWHHCYFAAKRSLIKEEISPSGGDGLIRRSRRQIFYEDLNTFQEARERLFPPTPVARGVLFYRELRVSGADRVDARPLSEVRDRARLQVPGAVRMSPT